MNYLKKIFLIAAVSFASFSFSQTNGEPGNATIDANYCLSLDATVAIQEDYTADASALNWTSEAEAKKMCGRNSNNLVSYEADYANNKIIVHIHTDRTGEVNDIVWWNAYLKSICK